MIELKEVVLLEDPKQFKGLKGWWSLDYATEKWVKCHPNSPYWGTSVTAEICPEIESLKKGDKVIILIDHHKVISVNRKEAIKRCLK